MKRTLLFLTLLLALTLSACGTSQPAPSATSDPTIELPSPATEPTAGSELSQPLTETTYLELLTTYSLALEEKLDAGALMEKGFDPLLADCYGDAPLENIGYAITDLDGDGMQELVIGTTENITDDFYGKLIFALYSLKPDYSIVPVFSSTERDRYYYAGDCLFAHLGSSGASDSFDTTVKYEDYSLVGTDRETTDYMQMDLLPMSQWVQQVDLSDSEPAALELPILDEINENIEIGTTGSFAAAVQTAVKLLDFGVGTGLDTEEIKDATIAWMMSKGNDEQVAFAEKLAQVDEAYQKLLEEGAEELLASAGCEDAAYPWSDAPVEPVEAIMEAVGLR